MRRVHFYQTCEMRRMYRVIRNVTWNMCTGLSEMWHETCVQGYQKCETKLCTGLSQMRQKCAHSYHKWDMRHLHRVIRNVTWHFCIGLSEMWHETCVQGYQKLVAMCTRLSEMWQTVYRVIRNVTDMCTSLSEMWHEICVQGFQKCDIHVHKFIRKVTCVGGSVCS